MKKPGRPQTKLEVSDSTLFEWYQHENVSYSDISKRLAQMGCTLTLHGIEARIKQYQLGYLQQRVTELEAKLTATEQLLSK